MSESYAEVTNVTSTDEDLDDNLDDIIDVNVSENFIEQTKIATITPSSVTLPRVIRPSTDGNTGQRLNDSQYRYEAVRLLLEGHSYQEISDLLYEFFNYKVTPQTIASFKRNFFPYYEEIIDRWEKRRYQNIVARLSEEIKNIHRRASEEVFEIQRSLTIIDERVKKLTAVPSIAAPIEVAINQYINTKQRLLERATRLTGSSGLERKLKDTVSQTMLAVQRTLIPYLMSDRKAEAFELLDRDLEEIFSNIDKSIDMLQPKKS